MCRWLAYSGKPVLMDKVLYGPQHSLIEQSLESRMGAEPTNGDGFGVGWYGDGPIPGVFHSIEPAWNDHNLHELANHISSARFFAYFFTVWRRFWSRLTTAVFAMESLSS